MRKELRLRATLYGAFLLACVVAVWPPYERNGQPGKIQLGLDLRGRHPPRPAGRDRRRPERDHRRRRCRPRATRPRRKGIAFAGAAARGRHAPSRSRAWSRRASRTCATSCKDFFRDGLGRPRAGRRPLPGQMTDAFVQRRSRTARCKEAISTLERRVNQLGVAEPVIAAARRQGRPDPGPAPRASPTSSRPSA